MHQRGIEVCLNEKKKKIKPDRRIKQNCVETLDPAHEREFGQESG